MSVKEMTCNEIDQFLTCARVGRVGMVLEEGPYVGPVGFVYVDGKVFFHTCCKGLKMECLRKNANVCFEVDESPSDTTMYKSVIIFGKSEIIQDEQEMTPHLQKLIDRYRVPLGFDEYMRKPGRNREPELKAVRICLITPRSITGRKMIP
jgi:nitroimidazol reductase NimA-like FMN-containing flavoprotein (pyridoxamine 5'-phosphate oxidase superfamily)